MRSSPPIVLRSNGWLLSSGRKFLISIVGTLPLIAVVVLGLARIQAGLANHKSVGILIALTAVAVAAAGAVAAVVAVVAAGAVAAAVAGVAADDPGGRRAVGPWARPGAARPARGRGGASQ